MSSISNLLKKNRLLIIVLLGLALRLVGLNWDQSFHLHPDERFLSMVAEAIKFPASFFTYLNPHTSPLNPNNVGYPFFVYGTFPLILTKTFGLLLNLDGYDKLFLLGRFLSAVLDTSVIVGIYLIAKFFTLPKDQKTDVYASLFYAVFVFPVQQAHFWTTDSFMNAFFVWSFYFSLRFYFSKYNSYPNLILSALFLALGIASKISILYVAPVILIPILLRNPKSEIRNKKQIQNPNTQNTKRFLFLNFRHFNLFRISNFGFRILVFSGFVYFFLRLFYPYLFASANFLQPFLNPQFVSNIKQLQNLSVKGIAYPPGYQWYNKNFFFGLYNIAFYGIGIVYFGLFIYGIIKILSTNIEIRNKPTKKIQNNKKVFKLFGFKNFEFVSNLEFRISNLLIMLLIGFWLVIFFLYQSLQLSKTMRYYIFLYPFIALVCGFGLNQIKNRSLKMAIFFLGFLWTLSFMHIYVVPHSRVTASDWIYKNIPEKSTLTYEYWDDPLPVSFSEKYSSGRYKIITLDVSSQPDSKEKWQLLAKKIAFADYIVLSSNRLWGSLPALPQYFPYAANYYRLLFDEKLGFKKLAEFTSFPSLDIGICLPRALPAGRQEARRAKWGDFEISDQLSEEAFTVYDHPQVLIFQKTAQFDERDFYNKITK